MGGGDGVMQRDLNEIEKTFFTAFCEYYRIAQENIDDYIFAEGERGRHPIRIWSQYPIGISYADFLIETNGSPAETNFVVEIDGQEYHKTKHQRYEDYCRERFFQKKGFHVVRFTGSEVFVDALKCCNELDSIINAVEYPVDLWLGRGVVFGMEYVLRNTKRKYPVKEHEEMLNQIYAWRNKEKYD